MHRFVLILCLAGAIGLIAYGMIQPVEQDQRWIVALWLAAQGAAAPVRAKPAAELAHAN